MPKVSHRGANVRAYSTTRSDSSSQTFKDAPEAVARDQHMLEKAGRPDLSFLFLNQSGRQGFKQSLVPVAGNMIGRMATSVIKKLGLVK